MKKHTRLAVMLIALLVAAPAQAQAQTKAEAKARTQAQRGWLGVFPAFVKENRNGRIEERVLVAQVIANSPAQRGGVLAGDTIVLFDDRPARRGDVDRMRSGLAAGEKVRLRLRRGGRERDVVLTAAQRPQGTLVLGPGDQLHVLHADSVHRNVHRYLAAAQVRVRQLETLRGARVMPLRGATDVYVFGDDSVRFRVREGESFRVTTPSQTFTFRGAAPAAGAIVESLAAGQRAVAGAEFVELSDALQYLGRGEGLLTLRVASRSPAAEAGLLPGDVVVAVDDQHVRALPELRMAVLRAERPVVLRVMRSDKPVSLRLGAQR